MKSGTLRLSVLLSALVGTVLSALPVGPAEAQRVMLARGAIGHSHHLAEGGQPGDRPGNDFANAPGACHLRRSTAADTALMVCVSDEKSATEWRAPGHELPPRSTVIVTASRCEPCVPTASLVVQAVLRICKEMGKHCEVGG